MDFRIEFVELHLFSTQNLYIVSNSLHSLPITECCRSLCVWEGEGPSLFFANGVNLNTSKDCGRHWWVLHSYTCLCRVLWAQYLNFSSSCNAFMSNWSTVSFLDIRHLCNDPWRSMLLTKTNSCSQSLHSATHRKLARALKNSLPNSCHIARMN
jgi:hypothetical protein